MTQEETVAGEFDAFEKFAAAAQQGLLGPHAKRGADSAAVSKVVDNIAAVAQFYDELDRSTPFGRGAAESFLQFVRDGAALVAVDPELGRAFLLQLHADLPDAPGSRLWPKFEGLARSCFDLKRQLTAPNSLGLVEVGKRLALDFNSVADNLIGGLIVARSVTSGQVYKPGIFRMHYGQKVKRLAELTGGADGDHSFLLGLVDAKFRNALAHGDIEYLYDERALRFPVGMEGQIRTLPLLALADDLRAMTYLPHIYTGAMFSVLTVCHGDPDLVRRLHKEIVATTAEASSST